MKIYFRKTFKYDPCHSGLSKYESYEFVTCQTYSPGIINFESSEHFNIQTYCSSLDRCQETAKVLSIGEITSMDELREIKFSLHNLVSNEEFERYGSALVRERFVKSFIDDTLLESRKSIRKRVNKVMKVILENKDDKLIVSHSFMMKMFEAYFEKNLDIFKNPKLISKVIVPNFKTYEFGKGFEVEI